MTAHATAAILSIGDELTLGQTLDTNSKWLSERLRDLGIVPVEHVTVPDDLPRHVGALRRLAGEVDLILCSGGLGPTADDLTREALARAAGDVLVEDDLALAQVESFFAARGRAMPPINRAQALRPSRGTSLSNLNGTAPGLFATIGACDVLCLPGPPGEMRPMFEQQVLPRLRPPVGRTVRTRAMHCFGIGESDLATRLGPLMRREAGEGGVLVGTTASGGVVSVRMRYEGPIPAGRAEEAIDRIAADVRSVAGDFIFGSGDETLAGVVVAMLRSRGERLGVVESCTGGLLGAAITDVPGSSDVFAGGLVTYLDDLKVRSAGVPADVLAANGAVSSATAAAMAEGGLERLGTRHCLAITGIAGPGGATPGKPVGTVFIARARRGGTTDVRRFAMAGDRGAVREWSVRTALAMLRFHLAGLDAVKLLRQVDVSER